MHYFKAIADHTLSGFQANWWMDDKMIDLVQPALLLPVRYMGPIYHYSWFPAGRDVFIYWPAWFSEVWNEEPLACWMFLRYRTTPLYFAPFWLRNPCLIWATRTFNLWYAFGLSTFVRLLDQPYCAYITTGLMWYITWHTVVLCDFQPTYWVQVAQSSLKLYYLLLED